MKLSFLMGADSLERMQRQSVRLQKMNRQDDAASYIGWTRSQPTGQINNSAVALCTEQKHFGVDLRL